MFNLARSANLAHSIANQIKNRTRSARSMKVPKLIEPKMRLKMATAKS
jgi:hypothetical protein